MSKRLTQHGNHAAHTFDKPNLRLLDSDLESELEVVTDELNLTISSIKTRDIEGHLLASLERVNQKHSRTLEKLAH